MANLKVKVLAIVANTPPVADNIVIDIYNDSTYVFKASDFTSKFSDVDGDTLAFVSFNNAANIIYNGDKNNVPIQDIANGLVSYTAPSVNGTVTITWQAIDSRGAISN